MQMYGNFEGYALKSAFLRLVAKNDLNVGRFAINSSLHSCT